MGLSQRQFSTELKLPLETLKKYEGDKRTPGGEALIAFARLGADVHYILTGDRAGYVADKPAEDGRSEIPDKEEQAVLDLYRGLAPEDRDRVKKIITAFVPEDKNKKAG